MKPVRIPRSAKGPRPKFFAGEPGADQLLGMVLALAAELSVLRERLDTAEQVAAGRGLDLRAEIEGYQPTLADRERREAWRVQFLQRLLQGVTDDVASAAAMAPPPAWPPGPPPGAPPGGPPSKAPA